MADDNDPTSWVTTELEPFWDSEGLRERLGLSQAEIAARVASNDLIALRTAEGPFLFPAFQFDDDGDLPNRLPELYRILIQQMSPTTAALWLHTKLAEWDNRTAVDILRDADPLVVERVFFEARDDVWRRER
jgi:hypothetical protein